MTILTDSGYIGEGDREGLRSILSRSKVIGDVVAVLPLHLSWVRDRDGQRILLDEVQGHGVPVALVLEHDSDPLGVQAAVAGLLQLLRLDVPVFLLRSDVSAIGALCFGAHGAAVGSRTSLRHLYPLRDSSGGRPARIAAVVPDCLTFRSLDTIALAVAADPDNTVWTCRCNTCLQRSLDWLATLNDDELASRKAFSHSAEILFDLRDSLLGDQVPLQERGDSWVETCQYAQVRNLEIAETTPKWDVPKFLGSWVAKAPVHPRTSDGTSLSDNSRRS